MFGGGSDSVGITGDHLFMGVGNEDTISVTVLEHDTVAGLEATIFSKGQSNLNLNIERFE
jgi:hypothetical protein